VLNKKFRAAQKVLDREAAYVAQAGSEIEKLLADLPPISISPTLARFPGTSRSLCPPDMVVNPMEFLEEDSSPPGNINGDELSRSDISRSMAISGDSETMMEDNSESNSNSNSTDKTSSDENHSKSNRAKGPRGKDVAKLLGALADRLGSLKRKV